MKIDFSQLSTYFKVEFNLPAYIKKVRKYLVLLFFSFVLIALYVLSLQNYLLFHTICEFFSIIVAAGIFVVFWHSRKIIDNSFFLFPV